MKMFVAVGLLSLALVEISRSEPVKVGLADTVRNDVNTVDGANITPVSIGDDIMQNEVLQTKADSDAKIVLLDETDLSIGPNSTVKIDKAVFATDRSYRTIGIKLTQGVFRLITGKSDKKSYKIETPTATIGVRGTILDIRVALDATQITLQDGAAGVCVGRRCVQLQERGHTANISVQNGAVNLQRALTPTWTFASVCSGNPSLCAPLPVIGRRAGLPTAPANALPAANLGNAARDAAVSRPLGNAPLGNVATPSRDIAPDISRPNVASPSLLQVPAISGAGGGLLRR